MLRGQDLCLPQTFEPEPGGQRETCSCDRRNSNRARGPRTRISGHYVYQPQESPRHRSRSGYDEHPEDHSAAPCARRHRGCGRNFAARWRKETELNPSTLRLNTRAPAETLVFERKGIRPHTHRPLPGSFLTLRQRTAGSAQKPPPVCEPWFSWFTAAGFEFAEGEP